MRQRRAPTSSGKYCDFLVGLVVRKGITALSIFIFL